MSLVNRFDTYSAGQVERLDNGFLRVPVFATRAGIFNYRLPDGSIRRELRHPDEVFKQDSLSSMRCIPVTNKHPSELVDSKNVREHMVGTTSDNIQRKDEFVETTTTLMDQTVIDAVEKKGIRDVSCGYRCDVVHEPGTYEGAHYDARQVNIKYNHLAVVPKGRAGPQVRLRMDSDDGVLVPGDSPSTGNKPKDGGDKMPKVTIGGVTYDAEGDLAQAIVADQQKRDAALADAEKELDTVKADSQKEADTSKAKLDQLTEENAQLKKDAADRPDVKQAVKARLALVSSATPHLDKETVEKLDEMDDDAVKLAVIQAKSSKFDAEGKSTDYINARFDAIVESEPTKTTKKDGTPNPLVRGVSDAANKTDGEEKTPEQVRADAMQRDENAWQKPLSNSTRAVAGGAQ